MNILKHFLKSDIGIDLGTSSTIICQQGKGVVFDQPTVVAIQRVREESLKLVAFGEEAKLMLGKTPESITAIKPIQESVIHNYQATELMLKEIFKKIFGSSIHFRPKVLVTVPLGITEVEKRAVRDAVLSAGARAVYLISEPLAAALGSNLPINESSGNLILDIGAGTTEVALLSLKGFVFTKSSRIGGSKMDEAIVSYVRKKYSLLIGETEAEQAKLSLSDSILSEGVDDKFFECKGRDLIRGTPRVAEISTVDIREAIEDVLRTIISTVRLALENVPPELASDIVENGITLTGGVAALKNLDLLISKTLNLSVYVPDTPRMAAINGLANLLNMGEAFEEFVFE